VKIIVEGPDNSGKSTLIRHLSGSLGIPVVPGEGPGRSADEINERVRRYATIENSLFDRHPCISQPIYNLFRVGGPVIDADLINQFYSQDVLFIYCRGTRSLEGTVWRDVDAVKDASGRTHQENVRASHHKICDAYDRWAANRAHVVYRIGDGFAKITAIVAALASYQHFDPVADIADFHTRFGHDYNGPPRALPKDLLDFRLKFIDEESSEYGQYATAATIERDVMAKPVRDSANYAYHLEHALDGLVDLVYVALGNAYLHGFNFREAWRRVHGANMKKVRKQKDDGTLADNTVDSGRAPKYDIVKPEGWEAPSHVDLVEVNDLTSPNRSER
jgi:predicted HAD superfamily Cof-like phosphohydrolase